MNKDKNKEVNKPDKGEEMYKDKEKEDMVFELPVDRPKALQSLCS